MPHFGIEQIFSLLGCSCIAISTFSKQKKSMFILQAGTSIFNGIANAIIGSPTGIITNTISLIRNILAAKEKWNKWTASVCAITCIIIGLISNQKGLIGLLPVIATSSYCVVLLFCKNAQHIRYALFYTNVLWSIYNFAVGLYIAGIMTSILVIFSIVNIIRFFISKNQTCCTANENTE